MENFTELKERILSQAIEKNACEKELERAKACETWDELKEVIIDNIWWCIEKYIELPDGHYKNSYREFTLVNGKLHGEFKRWFDNGQLNIHYTFKKGELHGEYKEWWSNGELHEHRVYKHGELAKTLV
jgi:antitoxin component YwqK of YwqJK toxin-antitoxin module